MSTLAPPPTVWQVARRPRWVAALVLALALAAGFAALGQWQLSRSFQNATVVTVDTETVRPLVGFATPQKPMTDRQLGQLVSLSGTLVAGDYVVLRDRHVQGADGAWLVGHVRVDGAGDPAPSVAVALGWSPDVRAVERAAERMGSSDRRIDVVGRYLPSEPAENDDPEKGVQSALSVAALINEWRSVDDVYPGYVSLRTAPAGSGLRPIDSPPPAANETLNLLNLFYAVEWAVFAGFAIYLWYRLVRDAWERETQPEED